MEKETSTYEHEYDSSLSVSATSISETKLDGGCGDTTTTSTTTYKTESPELSLLEVFETLEKERNSRDTPKMEFPEIMNLLEGAIGENAPKMDVPDILGLLEVFENFEKENLGQKSKISDVQNENTKLTLELKSIKEVEKRNHMKHSEEVNSLRIQIASLKLNLQNSDAERSTIESEQMAVQKAEMMQLRSESSTKSKQITELNKEISNLRKNLMTARPRSAGSGKALAKKGGFQEKELEYQKEIRRLQKQVRTLQRILYSKESGGTSAPASVSFSGLQCAGGVENVERIIGEVTEKKGEMALLESRVVELETALAAADTESKVKIKEFQQQLSSLRQKDRENVEKHVIELQRLTSKLENLKSMYDFSSDSPNSLLLVEVDALKIELEAKTKQVARLTGELSKLKSTRPRGRGGSAPSIDKSTAMLLEEKEVEHQRNLKKLQNQVRTLQRILYHKDPTSLPALLSQTKCEGRMGMIERGGENEKERQKFLEGRVAELENQLRLYTMKEKTALQSKENESVENSVELLISEMRARLIAQMKLVTCLKDHLGVSKAQVADLLKEKTFLEFRIRELTQELTLAKTLSKPENEILADLTETVQSLSSRYFYREKELDNLLSQLSVQNISSSTYLPHFPISTIPIPTSRDLTNPPNSQTSLALLLGSNYNSNPNGDVSIGFQGHGMNMSPLSPTTAMHLLGEPVDEFLFSKR